MRGYPTTHGYGKSKDLNLTITSISLGALQRLRVYIRKKRANEDIGRNTK